MSENYFPRRLISTFLLEWRHTPLPLPVQHPGFGGEDGLVESVDCNQGACNGVSSEEPENFDRPAMKSVRKTALLAHQLQYFSNPCANKAFLRTDYFCLELEKLKAEQLCSAKSLIPRLEVIAPFWGYENYFLRRLTSTFLLERRLFSARKPIT